MVILDLYGYAYGNDRKMVSEYNLIVETNLYYSRVGLQQKQFYTYDRECVIHT